MLQCKAASVSSTATDIAGGCLCRSGSREKYVHTTSSAISMLRRNNCMLVCTWGSPQAPSTQHSICTAAMRSTDAHTHQGMYARTLAGHPYRFDCITTGSCCNAQVLAN